MSLLEDGFARRFHYLRLSVTDVCNFRCTYCLPEGYRSDGRKHFLTLPEIGRVAHGFAALGTRKIRLTGGEPTLRRDFTDIVRVVADTPGIRQIALTTNGYRLRERVKSWREAGLTALNISVDSLDPRQFQLITGENRLADVMAGIDAALAAGFSSIKVNAVLLKGLNDQQLDRFLVWIRDLPIELRFIELMQTGAMDSLFERHHISGESIKQRLLEMGWIQQLPLQDAGPAQVFRHSDYQGGLGLIMPYSQDFCASCNRLRVSSTGKFHLCLFGDDGIELRDLLADDALQSELVRRIQQGLGQKMARHRLHQGNCGGTRYLASIGG